METPHEKDLLNTTAACKKLGVTYLTFRKYAEEFRIPRWESTVGLEVKYRVSDIEMIAAVMKDRRTPRLVAA